MGAQHQGWIIDGLWDQECVPSVAVGQCHHCNSIDKPIPLCHT
jgi:hypothetical protein